MKMFFYWTVEEDDKDHLENPTNQTQVCTLHIWIVTDHPFIKALYVITVDLK